jgi:hypothetical protein
MIFFYFCRGRARTYADKQFRRGGIIKCRALWENFETSLVALCVSHLISLTYARTVQFLREANAFFVRPGWPAIATAQAKRAGRPNKMSVSVCVGLRLTTSRQIFFDKLKGNLNHD